MKMKWIIIVAVVLILAYSFNVFGLKDAISGKKAEATAPTAEA